MKLLWLKQDKKSVVKLYQPAHLERKFHPAENQKQKLFWGWLKRDFLNNTHNTNMLITNVDNTNMNTSTVNDDLRDKSTDIVPQKSNDNSILGQLEKVKNKKMSTMLSS